MENCECILVKLKDQEEIFAYDKATIELEKDFIIVRGINNDIYFFGNKKSVDYVRYYVIVLPDTKENEGR